MPAPLPVALTARKAPWWLVAVVAVGASWSLGTDTRYLLTVSGTSSDHLVAVLGAVLLTVGCVVALRAPLLGVVMVVLGGLGDVTARAPAALWFFLFCALAVVVTGHLPVILALDVAVTVWSVANLAVAGDDRWVLHVTLLVVLAGLTAVKLRMSALSASAQQEHARAEQARRETQTAASAERKRIARDLHDVVAHDLTIAAMQCDAALLSSDPEAHETALRTVSRVAHRSLDDLRRVMNALIISEAIDSTSSGPAALDHELTQAVDHLRSLGLDVHVERTGHSVTDVGEAVQVALVPVLRELVTNAAKYADPRGPVRLRLDVDDRVATLEMSNDVAQGAGRRAGVAGSSGLGLVHLAERTRALDGQFEAHQEGARWLTRARIPVSASTPLTDHSLLH